MEDATPVPTTAPTAVRDRRSVLLFVVLCYVLAWAWWVPMAVSGTVVVPGRGWPTHLVGLMAPSVAAVVATAAGGGRRALADLGRRCLRERVDGRVYGIIALTALVGLVPALVLPGTDWSGFARYSGAPRWGVLTIVVVLVLNGFGEEVGWRGSVPRGASDGR